MKMKKCPFCEGEITPTAKKCKHCGEWVGKKKEEVLKKTDFLKIIKDFLSEYGIILIICIVIIYFWLKPSDSQNTTNIEPNNQKTATNNNTGEYEFVGDSKNIVPTEKGFTLFPNKPQECNLEGDYEIEEFVDAIRKVKDGEMINWSCPNQNENTDGNNGIRYISILFNNSYSKDINGNTNKNGPEERIAIIGQYLNNKNFFNKTSLDFEFMFTVGSNENSKEPDKNKYHFEIDASKYIKIGEGKPFYDDKRKTLIYRDVDLNISDSSKASSFKCIEKNNNEFACDDANSAYQEILNIYSNIYDKEDKHTSNMFLKNLKIDEKWFSGTEKDEIFIFTDGEFEIGYEREDRYINKLKEEYKTQWGHDQGADKTHNLSEFNMWNANRYQKDNKYESFWNDAIETLRGELPNCEGVKIYIIGLTRSAEFKPLAEKIYKQIFEPCEVVFK